MTNFTKEQKKEKDKIKKCSFEILSILEKNYSRKLKTKKTSDGRIHKYNSIGIYGNEVMTNIFEHFEIRDVWEKNNPAQQQLWWAIEKYCSRKIENVYPTMIKIWEFCKKNKITEKKPFYYHCDSKVFFIDHSEYKIVCYYGQSWQYIIIIEDISSLKRIYIRKFWNKEKFIRKVYRIQTSLSYFKKNKWNLNQIDGFKFRDSRDLGSVAFFETYDKKEIDLDFSKCELDWGSVPILGHVLKNCEYTLEQLESK